MEQNKYTIDLSNVRTKIRTYQEQGKDVLFSAIFIAGNNKSKLVNRASPKQLSLITKNLKCERPDKIRIELYDGKESANPLWFKEILLSDPEPEPKTISFQGLGEAEINRMVDERFQEKQRLADYEQLKERVMELAEENEELHDAIDELETRNTQQEQELESKKQIKYYTGMLGDILESFGIAKDRIKKPIAELMGISDDKPKQLESKSSDNSGIVDEQAKNPESSTEEEKRSEIISLISEYLRTTSNQTLANVFSIFSEIETDNSIADKIIQFVTTLKTTEHDNV